MSPVDPKVDLRKYVLEGEDQRKFAKEYPEISKRITAASRVLKSEVSRNTLSIKRLQQQKAALDKANRKLKQELADLEKSDLLKNKVAAATEALETNFNNKVADFQKQIEHYEKETKALKASLENIEEHPVHKKIVAGLNKNINELNRENLKLVAQLSDIESFPEFISKVESIKTDYQRKIIALETANNELKAKTVKLQTAMNNLDKNPVVKQLLLEREKQLQLQIRQQAEEISSLKATNKILQAQVDAQGVSEDVTQESFASFISGMLKDLETQMEENASVSDDTKFVVKEVEIDTKLLIEKRNDKPVYILPTAEKLKDVSPDKLQNFKFVIKAVPRF